jgi:hypothetical protein
MDAAVTIEIICLNRRYRTGRRGNTGHILLGGGCGHADRSHDEVHRTEQGKKDDSCRNDEPVFFHDISRFSWYGSGSGKII